MAGNRSGETAEIPRSIHARRLTLDPLGSKGASGHRTPARIHGTVFRYLSWTVDRAEWWYLRRLSRRIHRSTFGDATIAILCNIRTAEPYVLKNRIIDVYLGDRLATPTPAAAAAPPPVPGLPAGSGLLQEVGDLPGTYFSEELDVRWTVQPEAVGDITGIQFVKLR